MKDEEPVVLATWIMASDGTIIPSFHRYDYRTHTSVDKSEEIHGESVPIETRTCYVDGGPESFGRRGGEYTDMTVYSTDPFEVIRRFVCRGGRGKDCLLYTSPSPRD